MSRSVIVEWVHTASDPPSDLRSREMRLHLRDPSTKQEEDSIVWKSTFNCAQRCCRLPKEDITAPRRTFLDELDTVVGRQQREFAKSSQGQRQGRRQPRSNGQRSLTQQPDPRDPFNNQAPDQTLGNTRQRRDDDNDHHNQVEQGSSEEEDNQRRDQCRAKLFVCGTSCSSLISRSLSPCGKPDTDFAQFLESTTFTTSRQIDLYSGHPHLYAEPCMKWPFRLR